MNESAIQALAQAISKEQVTMQWQFYVILLALALVIGFGSAFVSAYARRRGESLATKADFDHLLHQVQATTAVAEEVKQRLSHADWASRELKTLRRIKLEELLDAVHKVEAWTEADRDARMFSSKREPGEYPMPRVEVVAGLYFPELAVAVHEYSKWHREVMTTLLESHNKLIDTQGNVQAHRAVIAEFAELYRPLYQNKLKAISELQRQSRSIMERLVGA